MRFLALAVNWSVALDEDIARVCGPEDEPDEAVSGDPESMHGEDDEEGFDDMPLAVGWEDEDDEDEDEDDTDDEDDDDGDDEDDDDEEDEPPVAKAKRGRKGKK